MNIKNWLTNKVALEIGLDTNQIDADEPFTNFDFDSLASISIAYEIEIVLELEEVNPTIFSEYNTINKLAEWIQARLK